MGLLSRKGRNGSADSGSNEKSGKKVQIMENVRKADGSMVQEPVFEYIGHETPSDLPPADAHAPPPDRNPWPNEKNFYHNEKGGVSYQQNEKSGNYYHYEKSAGASSHSYPINPIREDSMGSFSFPRKQSTFVVSQQELPEGPDYDGSEQSFGTRRKWKSSRWQKGDVYEKPWVLERDPRRIYERLIFAFGCLVGLLMGGYLTYTSWMSVTNSEYCPILDDNFTTGIDPGVWNYEIQRGGFGVQSFDWTTDDPSNIYTDEKGLHIVPTLTVNYSNFKPEMILDGWTLNLTADGTCTSKLVSDCVVTSNSTNGAIINPVRSARINTRNKRAIKYGKVEVQAKLPVGDWIWPAIWMMPQEDVYGQWPLSGEIDIMESRGNFPGFPSGGRDTVSSALHWGPNTAGDAYWRTLGLHYLPRDDFSKGFHTFGLEWGEKYMFMYLDSRLLQVFFIKWKSGSMWDRGKFGSNSNQSALNDPWTWTGRPNTPFDQDFFLIMNVAVGGQNGFFVDGIGNKPWLDKNDAAPRAFWNAANLWYPTWGGGDTAGMTVRSVKMWSLGRCQGT
ncbi:hypothetical protein B9Z65_3174 [Elsinoe australis]|uniref:GH16 domain-containing protein n=1 Tax=Elsinoe australis TaxID=40998 RepID=A0A2P7ZUM6_9PEZI|nr:hypothetical protein B9Z65_3174 [Elsinoe australis]